MTEAVSARRPAWECRYFVDALPRRFAWLWHEKAEGSELRVRFGETWGPIRDTDVYLLVPRDAWNVKLRRRSNSIKLKRRIDLAEGGFELWREEVDHELPAPQSAWESIVGFLPSAGPLEAIASAGDVATAVDELRSAYPQIVQIEVSKTRRFYKTAAAQLEIGEIDTGKRRAYSVQFEAPSLRAARRLRDELRQSDLGKPSNYVRFCTENAAHPSGSAFPDRP